MKYKSIIVIGVQLVFMFASLGYGQVDAINVAVAEQWDPSELKVRLTPEPMEVMGPEGSVKIGKTDLQVDINGLWQFHTDPPKEFWKKTELSGNGWAQIQVPGEWVMQGFKVDSGGTAGYRRNFEVPVEWKGQRVKLRADGVYSSASVWINGQHVGQHEGGFTPFELDVTGAVEPGEKNRIDLTVKSESLSDIVSAGSNYAMHSLGGITRKIYLFVVPKVNIASVHVETNFDEQYQNAMLKVMLNIANEGEVEINNSQIRFALEGPDGKRMDISKNSLSLPAIGVGEILEETLEIPVSRPEKWDAEHPNLYKLYCTLGSGGGVGETVTRQFGFREVEVLDNELFVNNRPVKLRGVNRHEIHPLLGRSLSGDLSRKDAELFKQGNVNYIRTSHYPPAEEFLRACDELGLYVELEAPICAAGSAWGHPEWEHSQPDERKYLRAIVKPTLEMIERDRSHPSIIIWSLANESQWGSNFKMQAELARETDNSRPYIFSSVNLNQDQGFCEIGSQHYPVKVGGKRPRDYAGNDRPVLFDEYAHVGRTNRREKITDPGLSDYYGLHFTTHWDEIYSTKACLGGAIWCGIDEVFYIDGKEIGWGYWGLIDGWRRPKPEYWHVKKGYSPIRIFKKSLPVPEPGEPLRIEVENRFDFANLSEIRTKWSIGKESGIALAEIAPRNRGIISIRPKTTVLDGKELIMEFYHRNGYLIDGYKLAIGKAQKAKRCKAKAAERLLFEQNDSIIKVSGRSFEWIFDSKTGLIKEGRIGQSPVVTGGPYLVVTPVYPGGRWLDGPVPDAFNVTLSNWKVRDVHVKEENEKVVIEAEGDYKKASGRFIIKIDIHGEMEVAYSFEYHDEVDVREIGLAFDVDRKHDTLSWTRDAHWTYYPEDHIGRAEGTAPAFRKSKIMTDNPFVEPDWPWYLDTTSEGTNDFRSTKRNIYSFSLKSQLGTGLRVKAEGDQHARAYVDQDQIRLQVADYSNMGDQIFRWWNEGKKLENGDLITGTINLIIFKNYEK